MTGAGDGEPSQWCLNKRARCELPPRNDKDTDWEGGSPCSRFTSESPASSLASGEETHAPSAHTASPRGRETGHTSDRDPGEGTKTAGSDESPPGKEAEEAAGTADPQWSPSCWRSFPAAQNPFEAVSSSRLGQAQRRLSQLPPLAQPHEIEVLLSRFRDVYEGKRFVLQGGDCAELFAECTSAVLAAKVRLLLQMSLILEAATACKVVRIGRIAGQYGKPRTHSHEVVEGRLVMTYRGDSVNGRSPSERDPQPERLVEAYFHSAATLNFVRSLLSRDSAFLRSPLELRGGEETVWELSAQVDPKRRREFEEIVSAVSNKSNHRASSLPPAASSPHPQYSFATPTAPGPPSNAAVTRTLFTRRPPLFAGLFLQEASALGCFASHEAVLLPYEEAMTRQYDGKFYDTSGHFLWVGDRTRQLDHAHIQFCRGLRNPIGVKVGPSARPDEIVKICLTLNPENIPGKVVLITRLGAAGVGRQLPPLLEAVLEAGVRVVWLCDPMHGNTQVTPEGKKRRYFEDMLNEVVNTLDVHRRHDSHLGGVHFELTGEHVFECSGGPMGCDATADAEPAEAFCDPRLNYTQALEMAFEIAQHMKNPPTRQTEEPNRDRRCSRDAN
ncbi:Class-II DAHP synthetase family protein [Besnoitia besnoiti]|uniref:Phospho-2-dehydro-3-deoxyheptonate aldolase n=1 Tax=Besnoitia besnoiti TaxID=94643 RepID=A0A2A9M787_BESBE|nr:Class-II DAHP synthetase family protein [Besnoitia besnoiti]PFH33855.1 Class-II DAHP synthetase family protein [Besnoitia besnoiti]